MSKFEDMCAAYADSRNKFFSYRKRCQSHMSALVSGFIEYCKIPPDQVLFLPCDHEPKENSRYSLPGAMHLDEDTYWYLGVQITLYEKPNIFPHQPILLILCVKDINGDLFVKIGRDSQTQQLNLSDESERSSFYDQLVGIITRYFKEGLQQFLETEAKLKRIGFVE
jgi:hypothetical protein